MASAWRILLAVTVLGSAGCGDSEPGSVEQIAERLRKENRGCADLVTIVSEPGTSSSGFCRMEGFRLMLSIHPDKGARDQVKRQRAMSGEDFCDGGRQWMICSGNSGATRRAVAAVEGE